MKMWSITKTNQAENYSKNVDYNGTASAEGPYFLQNDKLRTNKEAKPVHSRTISEFASETTLHGMGIVVQSRNTLFRRILWIMVILTMTGLCGSVVFQSVEKYLKYESVTSVSNIQNQTLDLPAITICSMSFAKASGLMQHYKSIVPLVLRSRSTIENGLNDMEIEILKNISTIDFLTHTSFSAKDLFVNCYFRTGETVSCEDYLTSFITEQSVCYTFHSKAVTQANGTKKQIDSGQMHGFTLTLDTMWSEYFYSNSDAGYGMFALVHDQSVYPFMQLNSFLLSPGEITYVALQRNDVMKLKKPYSPTDCIDTSLPENKDYSTEECSFNCLMHALYKGDCSHDGAWEPACSMYDTFAVALPRYYNNFVETTEDKKSCGKGCLPKCHEITYSYKLSTTAFHDILLGQQAEVYNWRDRNLTYIKQNYIQVKVYYDTLSITNSKQVASLDLERLLGITGGQLGLCLGASLITMAELLEFVFTYCIKTVIKVLAQTNNVSKGKTTRVQQLTEATN